MRSSTTIGAIFLLALVVSAAAPPAAAQGRPGGEVAYQVVGVHPQSWVVTARNMETGKQVKFKLNPRAFERKRFEAEVSGGPGARFTVDAPRNEPLSGCCELAEGGDAASGRSEGSTSRPPSADSRGMPGRPSAPPSGYGSPPGEGDWEIVSVGQDWVVTARQSGGGSTMRFRVEPGAFVGYEFRADLHDLRQGQGFTLIAVNALPLKDCCTLLGQ